MKQRTDYWSPNLSPKEKDVKDATKENVDYSIAK